MIGKTILHYKIIEKLGEGGMGVVYKAEDTKLKREVAIKFLPGRIATNKEERERFKIEAQAAAALNHPNITHIYAIEEADDEMFIVMEYINGKELKDVINIPLSPPSRGETVKSPFEGGARRAVDVLPIDDIINYATQISKGLDAAHKKDIVHRDIKSSNIMITGDGNVKIMDFGLAKVHGGTLVTKAGTTLGTAAYMSPEQARGNEVDHRSDIWSFGVVLYEMLTGQLPFSGDYEAAVAYSILNEEPEPISGSNSNLPVAMIEIVNKSLKKNVLERYQSTAELLSDLSRLQAEQNPSYTTTQQPFRNSHRIFTVTKKNLILISAISLIVILAILSIQIFSPSKTSSVENKSIAVLPFTDMSSEKNQEYFCDGLAEELINSLTKINGIRVAARTSAFQFKGKELDIRTIGEKLNVGTVLEGSLRKSDQKLRITAQLINVEDGFHLWSETYEKELEDIFTIQDEISQSIVKALEVKLVSNANEPIVKHSTSNIEAYNLYLQGNYYWNRRTEESLNTSLRFFQQAIDEDPTYALAYAGMANSYMIMTDWDYMPPKEGFPKARKAALKALEIDSSLAEAQACLGFIAHYYDWNWEKAEREYKRAIELNPQYPSSHQWYAEYLMAMNRFDEAFKQIDLAEQLDPLSLIISTVKGIILFFNGRNEEAIAQLNKSFQMDPDFYPALYFMKYIYEDEKRYEEAIAFWKKKLVVQGGTEQELASLDSAYQSGSIAGAYKWQLQRLNEEAKQEYVSANHFYSTYIGMGNIEMAFQWLEKAYQERTNNIPWLKTDPRNKIIRSDPRYKEYLKKVDLDN